MERDEIRRDVTRSASAAVIAPIAGMVVGLFVGAIRARGMGADQFAQMGRVIKWGVTGFFAGLALIVLVMLSSRRQDVVSIRRLMILVVIAGGIAWFFSRVLFDAIGYEGF